MSVPRLPPIQPEQEGNNHPRSDVQRIIVWLRNWWQRVGQQLDQLFTDITDRLTTVETTLAGITVAKSKAQVFTANGTFTAPHEGWFDVAVQAASGGAGGANGVARSGGAGAGQMIRPRIYMTAGQTATVTIGAGGAGGLSTPTDGGNGGDTTVVTGGVTYTARGGRGSLGVTTANGVGARGGQSVPDTTPGRNAQFIAGDTFEGANGASANTSVSGGACGPFSGGTSAVGGGGGGGASYWGAGGNGATVNNTTGQAGQGYGAAPGGSLSITSVGGTAGQPGVVIFYWIG